MAPASPTSLPVSSSQPVAVLSNLKARQVLSWFGPAFVASIAYIDPGNFGTNLIAGTGFGYKLLWVLLWSNLMAILIQYLSAKLGIYLLFGGHFLHLGLTRTTVMFIAAVVSAVCVFAILALELRGFRTLEF